MAIGDAGLVEHTTNDSYWANDDDGSGKNAGPYSDGNASSYQQRGKQIASTKTARLFPTSAIDSDKKYRHNLCGVYRMLFPGPLSESS